MRGCRRATRAVQEEHVRGVKTNIPLSPTFSATPPSGPGHATKFIDETPSSFEMQYGQDRATKVLKYIAQIRWTIPPSTAGNWTSPRIPALPARPRPGLKQLLDQKGPEAVKHWVMGQKKLLITDTTMRDAHQSLLSTRCGPGTW